MTASLLFSGWVAVASAHTSDTGTTSGPLTAEVYSEHSFRLKWWRPGASLEAILYTVFLDGEVVARTERQSYRFRDLQPGTSYHTRVVAYDSERGTRQTIGELEVTTLGDPTNPFEPVAEQDPVVTPDDETPSPTEPSASTVTDESLVEAAAQDLPTHAPDGTPYCD